MKRAAMAIGTFVVVYLAFDTVKGEVLQQWYEERHPQTPAQVKNWVVESSGYHGPRGAGTNFVTCVPAPDLELPRGERERWREIKVTSEVASTAEVGDPCPQGTILEEVG